MSERDATRTVEGDLASSRGVAALMAGFLLPPVAWFVQFQINYPLAIWACKHHTRAPIYAVALVFLAVSLAGGAISWRLWTEAGGEEGSGGPRGRTRFFAGVALFGCAMFSLVIVAQAIAALFFDPCTP